MNDDTPGGADRAPSAEEIERLVAAERAAWDNMELTVDDILVAADPRAPKTQPKRPAKPLVRPTPPAATHPGPPADEQPTIELPRITDPVGPGVGVNPELPRQLAPRRSRTIRWVAPKQAYGYTARFAAAYLTIIGMLVVRGDFEISQTLTAALIAGVISAALTIPVLIRRFATLGPVLYLEVAALHCVPLTYLYFNDFEPGTRYARQFAEALLAYWPVAAASIYWAIVVPGLAIAGLARGGSRMYARRRPR